MLIDSKPCLSKESSAGILQTSQMYVPGSVSVTAMTSADVMMTPERGVLQSEDFTSNVISLLPQFEPAGNTVSSIIIKRAALQEKLPSGCRPGPTQIGLYSL